MFGDFDTDMEAPLMGYARKLTGVKAHLENSHGDFITVLVLLGQVLELLQRVVLDLTDALARDAELAADLFARADLPGEWVIVEGLDKVRSGEKVKPLPADPEPAATVAPALAREAWPD